MAKKAKTFGELIAETEAKAETLLVATRKALKDGKAKDYDKKKGELTKVLDDRNFYAQRVLFEKFLAGGTPYVDFSKVFFYSAKRLKETHDKASGETTDVSIESASRRLSLTEFIKKCDLDTTIIEDIKKLLTLLTIREKNILTLSADDLANGSNYFIKMVRAKASGETPDSNRQICLMVQGIMDKCGIECKVTNRELNFLQTCAFTHDGRGKCRVKPVTAGKFSTIIVDIMNHFTEGTEYSVLEKKQKEA